jgi:polyisoprenoid-binding protein YceI
MSISRNRLRTALLGLALVQSLAGAAQAQSDAPQPPPGPLPHGEKDGSLAVAGTYALDPAHAGVLAYVSHLGFSHSVFRFDRVKGTLNWDPKAVGKSTLSIAVETASITSNVEGFAKDLAGDKYLNAAAHPEATFVSTAFRQTDAAHGQVDGNFTLMGKTRPVTFDVTLIGAGPWFGGAYRMGVQARAAINPQDYGLNQFFVDPIEIVVDTEFEKAP